MPLKKFVKLNTGAEMPVVGLGTWKSPASDVTKNAVEVALRTGYRHIDTAAGYDNEKEVGIGIKKSGVPRNEIFLTTKLINWDMRNPEKALFKSLELLDTPYLDLWLMHWPAPMTADKKADKNWDWLDTWKVMESLYKKYPDKLKAIGVSNFSVKFLERLLANCEIVPAVNQIELHPSCTQQEVVNLCVSRGIGLTAYSPLGSDNSPLLMNAVVQKIANKYDVHAVNVLVSLQANRPGVSVIPKSVTASRIQSNFKLIELSNKEVEELNAIEKVSPFRACHPRWTGWGSIGFPDCE
ncbi:NADP-dependent oxidoreductase domain-containing protein [Amanita rubescens]|nr:NADP-dependent oxidoreductase domain-containing protein [Amanita rubescens]